ncbi:hypothetical protein GQ44DRAFT_813781 [Phaeosphaeriaceae sp. PMI808]|nr:hypothetical protein GQ44DRAFT_813781 [Phaeosphaeriaceae sp. PMI808]
MRPLQLLLSLSPCLITLILLYATLGSQDDEYTEETSPSQKTGVKALFSFTSPSSLFPPSAIISLTDDNSTFFLARPAAFGPDLPKDGLSSALWIGSGFGEDSLGQGELGCGDNPDWYASHNRLKLELKSSPLSNHAPTTPPAMRNVDDIDHSDIQSLQESAEIDGKVVLLKRGGCGFLAKVLWAQKRGAVAVIVGDNVRGGPLIQMYPRGDTTNVTIPSLFTSHTTAHLLSSLLPVGATSGQLPDRAKIPSPSTRPLTESLPSLKPNSQDQQSSANGFAEKSSKGSSWVDVVMAALGLRHDDEKVHKADSRRPPSSTIGKQDWQDSDLLSSPASTSQIQSKATPSPSTIGLEDTALPGSGEYSSTTMIDSEQKVGWNRWFGSKEKTTAAPNPKHAGSKSISSHSNVNLDKAQASADPPAPHQGLWVTLTPTNVSTSPFFDTLLVLVVSPLVTLTVVYILLLLRSRIRRRRWRAPKSLVERLPVRTYQTMSDSTSSATASASSPTTPLLQHGPSQPTLPVHSPLSPNEEELPAASSSVQNRGRTREEEKREAGLAEWRRRYGGRQKECVVCLEDYVDGISQVMSLPCGHEFHADCITPWLVTRRRTCPICKGDVVRSLAQSYHDRLPSPSPTRTRLHLDNVDNIQAQAAEIRNDSPSASLPMPISTLASASGSSRIFNDDLEANWPGNETQQASEDANTNRIPDLSSSVRDLSSTVSTVIWRGVEAVRNTTGLQRRPPGDVDRDR